MFCTCATASSFSALQRSCCELPRIKPNWLLVFAIGPSLTLALYTHRYGIAQALESATRTQPQPQPLPPLSHARGVPCLGFVFPLRRRSNSVRRAPHCPAVHPHRLPPYLLPPLAVPRLRQGGRGASNAIPTAPPLTTATTTTNATHPFPFFCTGRSASTVRLRPRQTAP